MELSVAVLVVASALLHALWNAALKRQPDPEGASVAVLAVAALVALCVSALASGPAFPGGRGAAWSLAAGLCEGGYFATLALAFRAAPFGVAYTVARGGALVAVWPASVALLGEAVTPRAAGGALLVMGGLAAVGLDQRGRATAAGVVWATACALCIAGYHLAYKLALDSGAAPAAVFATALSVALPLCAIRLGRGGLHRSWTALGAAPVTVAAAGLLCTSSFLLFLSALARGGAGATATLRNTSVLFGLLLARLLGERPTRWQVLGTVGVAAGAVLLGWPP